MSGIYIPGIAMPKRGHTVTLTIMGGGEAVVQYYDCKPQLTVPIVYKAIPVPEHGRLIDADALIKNHFSDEHRIAMSYADKCWMRRIINGEPTIIPASGGNENE